MTELTPWNEWIIYRGANLNITYRPSYNHCLSYYLVSPYDEMRKKCRLFLVSVPLWFSFFHHWFLIS